MQRGESGKIFFFRFFHWAAEGASDKFMRVVCTLIIEDDD